MSFENRDQKQKWSLDNFEGSSSKWKSQSGRSLPEIVKRLILLLTKKGTKTIILLLWIKSSKKPQIKKFNKTDPPKVGIVIQNTISKFSKLKNQTKKLPFKIQKPKKASNQKHL